MNETIYRVYEAQILNGIETKNNKGMNIMTLVKGTYVRHPKEYLYREWGYGIVIADEVNKKVDIFFETAMQVKTMGTDLVKLIVIADPGQSAAYLNNAVIDSKFTHQYSFPEVLDTFLTQFEGGLQGRLYLKEEREYKVAAHELAITLLNKSRFEDCIKNNAWDELSADIKRVYAKVNLLASFEMIKLADAFKKIPEQEKLCMAFYQLLHGSDPIPRRIDKAQLAFSPYELDKWTIITYPLFILFPNEFMFVKPTMTRAAASNRRFDIQYDSKVNGQTYKQVMLFSQNLFESLIKDVRPELHPIDMIDVQGFMWCTFAGGWSDADFKQAKKNLENGV